MPNALQQLALHGLGFATKAAGQGLRLARGAAELLRERAFGDGGPDADEPAPDGRDGADAAGGDPGWPSERPATPTDTPTAHPGPAPPAAEEAVAAELAEPPAWEPDDTAAAPIDPVSEHVSEEATLVAESADLGAEGGAGPEITIAPPWPGYDQMRARDIVDRLNAVEPNVAAAVRLYESSKRSRKTILDAAERATTQG